MREISNMRMISILFKKEMKDIFRDRKSVVMMFFVPVIIYPLIFLVSFFIISSMQTGVSVQNYNIVLDGVPDDGIKKEILKIQADENENRLTYKVSFFDMEDFAAIAGARYGLDTGLMADKEVGIIGGADEPTAEFLLNESGQTDLIKNAIADELIDAYVSFQDDKYSVYYNSSVTNSSNTVRIISDALSEVKKALVIKNIENEGLDANEILNPIETEENDTATSEQSLGFLLGTIIPFMMIMGLLSGILSPAMDSTVGEKERGTLESLLMMPVSESQIIIAKFFSVALVGLITTLLSVISMAGLGLYMLNLIEASGIEGFGGINTSQFLPAILIALPVLIVLSLFLTSITMCVTCFARSNKEAGNYIAPIMFVTMFTSYIGFIPNIEFDRTLAMVPVANVCLLIKNLLLFKVDPELILIVIGSMAVYTGLIILLLGRVYKTENILYDEGRNSMAILERRSNLKRGGVPTSGDGWFTVMVGFILLVYVGGLLQAHFALDGVAMTQIMMLVFPLLMVLYTKKDIALTFSLRFPGSLSGRNSLSHAALPDGDQTENSVSGRNDLKRRMKVISGSLLFGIGAILAGLVTSIIMAGLFPEENHQFSDALFSMFDRPGIYVWFVVALMPAICEEMFFRGYVLAAFKSRYPVWLSIVFVGVFFGIYHTSLMRFPSTALLGMAFAYLTYKTGSIFPGMFFHCLNNSIAVASMYFPEWMESHLPFLSDEMSVTTLITVCVIAVFLIVMGVLLMRKKTNQCP